jgi:Tol biopolymer transport system component
VLAAGAVVASAASGGGSTKSDLVVFARVRSFSELVTVHTSGAPKHRIAEGGPGTVIGGDSWSPSGRKIVFAFYARDGQGLLIVPASGGAVRRLTWRPRYSDEGPLWSPDGRWIAFTRVIGARLAALFLVHPDGTALHRASPCARRVAALAWAPDSRRLLIQTSRSLTKTGLICDRVAILKLGSAPRTVRSGVCGDSATWSPDGRKIAFVYNTPNGDGENALVVEDTDGSRERVIVPRNAGGPSWSPDGKRIAFSWYSRGAWGVTTVAPDGRDLRVLTHDNYYSDAPKPWSTDGRWILFERQDAIEDFDAEVVLIHPDATGAHAVARDVRYSTATWRPR